MSKERELQREIERAYRVLGEQAEMQNETDINQWFKNGLISEDEKKSLKEYSSWIKGLMGY